MLQRSFILLTAVGVAAIGWSASSTPREQSFEELALTLEYNGTDGQGEVILHAESGLPLDRAAVIAPDGRVLQRIDAATPGGIGISELRLESGEPGLQELLASYPTGTYVVRARALTGELVTGLVELSHELPTRFVLHLPAAETIPLDGLVVGWSAGPEVRQVTVEVVDDTDDTTRVALTPPAGTTSVTVPAEVLEPDREYQVVVTATSASGNRLLLERYVRTAP